MKRNRSLCMMLVGFLIVLTGCTVSEEKKDSETNFIETKEISESAVVESAYFSDTLEKLREEVIHHDDDIAVAYLGYIEAPDMGAILDFVHQHEMATEFTFLKDISEEQIVLADGGEVYCIVPALEKTKLYVRKIDMIAHPEWGEDDFKQEEVLYEGGLQPIILVANESDLVPNVFVEMISDDEDTGFSPYISLKDGSLNFMWSDDIYEFTTRKDYTPVRNEEFYSGQYTDQIGNEYVYNYEIPEVQGNTLSINKMNECLENAFEDLIEEQLELMEDGLSLHCSTVMWDRYESEKYLSIVMYALFDTDEKLYYALTYDKINDCILNQKEMVEQTGWQEEELLTSLQMAAKKVFEESSGKNFESDAVMKDCYERTIDMQNMNMALMMYINSEEQIEVITPIISPAGAESYTQILVPER